MSLLMMKKNTATWSNWSIRIYTIRYYVNVQSKTDG